MLPRPRSTVPNDVAGSVRDGPAARPAMARTGGSSVNTGAGKSGGRGASTITGSAITGGGEGSSGTVASGGNGWAQPRRSRRGVVALRRVTSGDAAAGLGTKVSSRRAVTGGGGFVPGGAPSASRKRRTRSSSLCGGWRRTGVVPGLFALGGGSGFSVPFEAWLVSHLKTSASPAKTRKIIVSFT